VYIGLDDRYGCLLCVRPVDIDVKKARERFYDSYNFAGTTDWAANLQTFYE
jgi:hypothetical protein